MAAASQQNRQDSRQTARIWFYSRDVEDLESGLVVVKHWAIKVDYMSRRNPGTIDKRVLYEAVCNERGILEARAGSHGDEDEDEWEARSGFVREDHGEHLLDAKKAEAFIRRFNQLEIAYVATKDNCQMFASEFVGNMLPEAAISLPVTAQEARSWFGSVATTSLGSLANLGSGAMVKQFLVEMVAKDQSKYASLMKEAIKNVSLNGAGPVSLLSMPPVKEYMAQEGFQLALTASGEMLENMVNATRGAFSWLNLIQAPVEILTKVFMKSKKFTDLEAHAASKLASAATAAGVGALGGPAGSLGAVAVWISIEITMTVVWNLLQECLMTLVNEDRVQGLLGMSDNEALTRSVVDYFRMRLLSGLHAGLEWMKEYIMDGQKKKLE